MRERTMKGAWLAASALCTALLLACALLVLPAAGLAASTSLSVAIVADDHLALRPLELNHRDVVSLLNLVYEGLFEIDDNYQPQPKLAYAYSFSNDGRKVQVTLRDDISFHNGQTLTSADVVATLDYMLELAGFDENLDSEVPVADRGLYYSTFYSIKSWEATDDQTIVFTLRRARPAEDTFYFEGEREGKSAFEAQLIFKHL